MILPEQMNGNTLQEKKLQPLAKHPKGFLLIGVGLGWMVDFLFWGHEPGISVAIWVILALAALLLLAWIERVKPNAYSCLLMGLIIISAGFTMFRLEPLTFFLNTTAALLGLILLAATFPHGYWVHYRLMDYVVPFFGAIFGGLPRVISLCSHQARDDTSSKMRKRSGLKILFAVLRGGLLALPILMVLGTLLASADPVFAEQLNFIVDWFTLNHILTYSFRLFYILLFSFIFIGVLLQAILPTQRPEKPDPQRLYFRPFLGWIETAMIMGSINLMFFLFVIVQFNYLFGGRRNIHLTGFNYAEYAQRGFSELVFVSILSFMIYLSLVAVSRLETKTQTRGFSGLSAALILQVIIILASSFQRLALYEAAYGFTRLRMYTHVFIVCLAIFLVSMLVLEGTGKKGRFGLLFLFFCYGYAFSLGSINVDGMITRQNLKHANSTFTTFRSNTLDYDYLRYLSNDATLILIRAFENEDMPLNTHEKIGAILACRAYAIHETRPPNWRSYRPMDALMQQRVLGIEEQVSEDFVARKTADGVFVKTAKNDWQCDAYWDDRMD